MRVILVLSVTILLLATSCTTANSEHTIATVEKCVSRGDYGTAREMCDEIVEDSASCVKSISDLCRMSVVMMKLSEQQDDETSTMRAVEWCRNAYLADSAEAARCYDTLATDETATVVMLHTLASIVGRSHDIPSDDEIDSLMLDAENYITNETE